VNMTTTRKKELTQTGGMFMKDVICGKTYMLKSSDTSPAALIDGQQMGKILSQLGERGGDQRGVIFLSVAPWNQKSGGENLKGGGKERVTIAG